MPGSHVPFSAPFKNGFSEGQCWCSYMTFNLISKIKGGDEKNGKCEPGISSNQGINESRNIENEMARNKEITTTFTVNNVLFLE